MLPVAVRFVIEKGLFIFVWYIWFPGLLKVVSIVSTEVMLKLPEVYAETLSPIPIL